MTFPRFYKRSKVELYYFFVAFFLLLPCFWGVEFPAVLGQGMGVCSGSTPRSRQREGLDWDTVTTQASAGPPADPHAGLGAAGPLRMFSTEARVLVLWLPRCFLGAQLWARQPPSFSWGQVLRRNHLGVSSSQTSWQLEWVPRSWRGIWHSLYCPRLDNFSSIPESWTHAQWNSSLYWSAVFFRDVFGDLLNFRISGCIRGCYFQCRLCLCIFWHEIYHNILINPRWTSQKDGLLVLFSRALSCTKLSKGTMQNSLGFWSFICSCDQDKKMLRYSGRHLKNGNSLTSDWENQPALEVFDSAQVIL